MTDALITYRNDRIDVDSAYDEAFIDAANDLGGEWDGDVWSFDPDQADDVLDVVRSRYDDIVQKLGTTGDCREEILVRRTYECGHALGVCYSEGESFEMRHEYDKGARLIGPVDMSMTEVARRLADQLGVELAGCDPDASYDYPALKSGTDRQREFARDVRSQLSPDAIREQITTWLDEQREMADLPEDRSEWSEWQREEWASIERYMDAIETTTDAVWWCDRADGLRSIQNHINDGDPASAVDVMDRKRAAA
jgi:PAS domain-containing protein